MIPLILAASALYTGTVTIGGADHPLTLDVAERVVSSQETHAVYRYQSDVLSSLGFAYSDASGVQMYPKLKDVTPTGVTVPADACGTDVALAAVQDGLSGPIYFDTWHGTGDDRYCDRGPQLGTITLERAGESRASLRGGILTIPTADKPDVTTKNDVTVAYYPDGVVGYQWTNETDHGNVTLVLDGGGPITVDADGWRFKGPSLWNADGSEPDEDQTWLVGKPVSNGEVAGQVYRYVQGQAGALVGPFSLVWLDH